MAKVKITLNDGSTKIVQLDDNFTDADIEEVTNSLNSTLDLQGQGTESKPFQLGIEKKIDLRPSGLARTAAKYAVGVPTSAVESLVTRKPFGEVFNKNQELFKQVDELPAVKRGDTALDIGTAFMLPEVKAVQGIKGANAINRALTGAYQGGLIGGAESLANEGDLSGVVGGAGIGSAVNIALPPAIQQTAKGIEKVINNPIFRKGTANTLEALTSVPSKYSDIALENELAGNTIFGGKFNPETAYIPIERKLREAKGLLPTAEDFAKQYRMLGERATQGINELEQKAAAEINDVLGSLHNKKIKNNTPQLLADSVINSFGAGGVYNAAEDLAPGLVNNIKNNLGREGLTLMDLHRIKEGLYDVGYAAAGAREGTKANVARGVANQINNYLRGVAPGYKAPNERFAVVQDVKRGLTGDTTIAGKIKDIGQSNNILSGLDERLHTLDNLLPQANKFVKEAKTLANSENEINAIRNTIGKQYERNPRLLSNRNDEVFEQALDDLQAKTGVNFMDDLNKTRAREALENIFPGQGGGSGSAQGFGNLVRTSIIGGTPTAALLTHNPLALAGLGAVSPKFMAQGTIKNLGKLNKAAKNLQQNIKTNFVPYMYGIKELIDRD